MIALPKPNYPVDPGVHVYIGTTGTGKTHLAIQHSFPLARSLGQGMLIIDCRAAGNFKEMPVDTVREASVKVFERKGIARVIPRDEEQFEALLLAADRYGKACILIDECATFASSRSLSLLVRVWRHRELSLFLTTQKVGRDVEQSVLACDPTIYLFRVTNPRSLEWACRWYDLDETRLRSLDLGEHYRLNG